MGGPVGNATAQGGLNYKSVPNNTKDLWIKDPGMTP